MNEYRNESSIEVNGVTYTLRPSFAAMAKIESQISKFNEKKTTVVQLLMNAESQGLSAMECKIILKALSDAAKDPIPDSELEEYIFNNYQKTIEVIFTEALPRMVLGSEEYNKISKSIQKEDEQSSKK